MTTPDNRALWELVDEWRRKSSQLGFIYGNDYAICSDELAAILERPVVVGDEDVELACKAFAKKRGRTWPTSYIKEDHDALRDAIRAALESMVRGKSRACGSLVGDPDIDDVDGEGKP